MTKPLIGVTGRRAPSEKVFGTTPLGNTFIDLHISDYLESVAQAGGTPLGLNRYAMTEELFDALDGIVLCGGADINPDLYGAAHEPGLGPLDRDRDEWEMTLVAAAEARDIPLLAICRGFQLVNVARGGTLHQDIAGSSSIRHSKSGIDPADAAHTVRIESDSTLAALYGDSRGVNSLHHQALRDIGHGLRVTATADDGVAEGIEDEQGRILGVQWHPEMMAKPDPAFTWLVTRAAAFRSQRAN